MEYSNGNDVNTAFNVIDRIKESVCIVGTEKEVCRFHSEMTARIAMSCRGQNEFEKLRWT